VIGSAADPKAQPPESDGSIPLPSPSSALTAIETVAVLLYDTPSFTLKVKLSSPVYSCSGV
jgi:hypothetical protein